MRKRGLGWPVVGLSATACLGGLFLAAAGGAESSVGVRSASLVRSAQPVLTIVSPHTGDTVTPPWPVRFAIAGLKVTPAHPVSIFVGIAGQSAVFHLTAKRQKGVVEVPDDRFFSGRRDVVFTLARGDGTPYPNSGASVTVANLIIAGSR
jgi:hypothetical protein